MEKFIKKKFTIYKLTFIECIKYLGGVGICDFCNETTVNGYYIPVLNSYYCEDCYKDFIKRAVYYEEERKYEKYKCNIFEERVNSFKGGIK